MKRWLTRDAGGKGGKQKPRHQLIAGRTGHVHAKKLASRLPKKANQPQPNDDRTDLGRQP
jgi:hypothetical protein